jgi:hypothetical protein
MKSDVVRCVVVIALFIGLPEIAAAAPLTSIESIPGRTTITFSGNPTGSSALNAHLAKVAMYSPTPATNFVGYINGLASSLMGNASTGVISSNAVDFGSTAGEFSTITIETTGNPWVAFGYTAFMDGWPSGTFSIAAYDVSGTLLEYFERDFQAIDTSAEAINNAMIFLGVSSSSDSPIYKVELTHHGTETTAYFDNLTFQSVSPSGLQPLVDLTFNRVTWVVDPPEVGCDGGVATLSLKFKYNGSSNYYDLFYRILTLDAPRTVLGALESDFTILNANLGSDLTLTTGEVFTADLPICLPNLKKFTLFLDVYGKQAPDANRVFVTSTVHDGDLNEELPAGGLAGGDAICQARADAVPLGGTWTAWLSAPGISAASRITSSAYVLVDKHTLVATSLSDLTDGTIQHPLFQDEWGAFQYHYVWTGTAPTGTATANTCNSWTTNLNSVSGDNGLSFENGNKWTREFPNTCNLMRHLYCFED